MLKGCQKKIIHIRNPQSSVFEEVYFILRDGAESLEDGDDMLKAAMKIVESTALRAKNKKRRSSMSKAVFILLGISLASLFFASVMLFSSISA